MLLSLKVKVNSVFAGEFSQTETMCLQEVMLPLPPAERFCSVFFFVFFYTLDVVRPHAWPLWCSVFICTY